MSISAIDLCESVLTDCCGNLFDIENVTSCELTGEQLCCDHIVFVDITTLKFGIVKLLDDSMLDGSDFILTFRTLAKQIQNEIFMRAQLSENDIKNAIDTAVEKYYRGEI